MLLQMNEGFTPLTYIICLAKLGSGHIPLMLAAVVYHSGGPSATEGEGTNLRC